MTSRNRGKPKPKLRDLSRQSPSEEEVDGLLEAVASDSPVTRAIVGSVFIEHLLEQAIQAKLSRQDDDTWTGLTDDRGPLATFNAKIEMGYALGVYDDGFKRALHIVRAVRNAFAHAKRPLDFGHTLILNELSAIPQHKKSSRIVRLTKSQYKNIVASVNGNAKWAALIYLMGAAFYKGKNISATAVRSALMRHSAKREQRLQAPRQGNLQGIAALFQSNQSGDPTNEAPLTNSLLELAVGHIGPRSKGK